MKKLLRLLTVLVLGFLLVACDGENVEDETTNIDRLQAYVDERGPGIAEGFEARYMNDYASVSV